MRILLIFIEYYVVTVLRFTNQVPETAADEQFIFCKKLSYSALFPWLALAVAIVSRGKTNLYVVFATKHIGQYAVLLQEGFFL